MAFPPRRRVLVLGHLPPPVHGASIMTQYAVEAFQTQYDVTSIRISTADGLGGLGEPSIGKVFRFLRIFLKVLGVTFQQRFDLVYITLSPISGAFFKDALLLVAARLRVKACLIHIHGKGVLGEVAGRPWMGPLYRFVFRLGTVIHLAPSLVADVAWAGGRTRILPNGITVAAPTAEKRDIDFLFLSNMIEAKGPFVLLEALCALEREGLEFRAVFCGKFLNESERQRFHSIADKMRPGAVSLIEGLYGEAKFALLQRAKVFVLPTFYPNECFPLSVLEAMGSGCAVISTEEGAIPDMLDGGLCGLLVKRQDPVGLAAMLQLAIQDELLIEKLSKAGKQRFDNLYTKNAFFAGLLGIADAELKGSG